MKLTTVFILAAALHVSARSVSQNISFSGKEVKLTRVFTLIEKQTGYLVVYPKRLLQNSEPVTLDVNDMPLNDFLGLVLKDRGLDFSIDKRSIFIFSHAAISTIPYPMEPGIEALVQPLLDLSGHILGADGTPLPGATVSMKGVSKGTSAGADGSFSISGLAEGVSLVVSAVGYLPMEITVKNGRAAKTGGDGELTRDDRGTLVIRLRQSQEKMKDVVVTGYFARSKESFTGAVSAYTGAEIQRANPVNVLAALSILEPSFKMIENQLAGSDPNIIPDFVIRGESSLPDLSEEYKGNPNNPIFILDGFEVSAERVFDLDPMLIASVTILKDAASTAIYGSRASNGVVVIESKRPDAGLINVSYNVDVSFTTPDLRDYHLLDATQKLELEKAAGYYDISGNVAEDEKRQDEYNEKLRLIRSGNNTYWLNKPLQAAVGHKHSLSVEGGESALRYALDINYEQAPGVMKGSGRDKKGVGAMLQYRYKNITFQNRILYSDVKAINSPYGQFAQYARINPYFRYDDDEGNYIKNFATGSWFLNIPNPLYNTTLHTIDESSYSQFINNFALDWYIIPSLRLQGNIAISQRKDDGVVFKPADHTDFLNYNIPSSYRRGQYIASEGKQFSYDGKIQLNYLNHFGRHVLNAGIAANIREANSENYSLTVEGFPADKLDYLIFGLQYPESSRPSGSDDISRLLGVLTSANYVYDNRYLLDASFRTDASSKFGALDRWAPFWSVGAGWNLHKEKFFENFHSIDRLKLRATYGITGSQTFDPYQSMTRYEYYLSDKYNYLMGAIMRSLGNKELKWQQTHQMNLGMDLSLFRKVDVTFNYYRNISKSLLADITLPPSLGFTTYKENIGEMLNRGIELNVRAMVYKGRDAYVNVLFGAIHNTNTIEKISNSLKAWNESQDKEVDNKPKVRYIEGQSINTIWGVPSVGINPANGKEIFITPDGKRTDIWDPLYQQPIGVSDPDFEGNFGVNGGYKNISLNLYFRYRSGGQMYNSTLVERVENADKRYNTDVRVLEDRWQKPGDITFFKDIRDNSLTRATSRFLDNYSYMQLSSASLYYDFGSKLSSRLKMKSMRLAFSMNDLFRISTVKAERGINYPFSASFRTSLRVLF